MEHTDIMKIILSWFERKNVGIKKPWWYRFSYTEYVRACDIYYPIPINYIIRYGLKCYWWVIFALDWVGLFDTPSCEVIRWSDFFRIKSCE